MEVLDVIWHALRDAFLMAWEVWWALVLGFLISAVVQAWVPRRRIESALAGGGIRQLATATGLGAVSSSCSYAAVAIAKSLFQKGASAASALAFQIASTNLVWELGLVLWVLIGWQFTLGEYLGGIVMIGLVGLLLRLFVDRGQEESARRHAQQADAGHQHRSAATPMRLRRRLTSTEAWSDVAHNFRGDWQMVYKEVAVGFLLAGFVAQIGNGALHSLFLTGAPAAVQTVWGAFIGPLIAVLSFVCSVGNVPLAAVLWSGGISFAGVMAFILADLIVLPIVAIYRKYYGVRFALRITALMFIAMVLTAILVDIVFGGVGLIPQGARPTRTDIFSSLTVNYKLFLNVTALLLFAALFWMTVRHGATDPVCGMKIERRRALTKSVGGKEFYFCSQRCLREFEADPERYAERRGRLGTPVGHSGEQPMHVRLNPVRVLMKTR